MKDASILVVDDDPSYLSYMVLALSDEFTTVRSATGGFEALLAVEAAVPDVVISDLRMPGLDGLELLVSIKERWPEVPVILVTVEQEIATVVEAVKRGATNYLAKPSSPSVLCAVAARALATSSLRGVSDRSVREIVGMSPAMVRVRHLVALAARSDVNVLVTGETGTGKELVARAIHRLSSLAGGPFVPHNCAVSPHDLFESQFFGHRRGAFTGAERDQRGLLEEADGGVLFLDELECLSPSHQAKLLRVLDDGEVQPVGSVQSRAVSVRFLSATNRNPATMLEEGALREDLYYRLRGFEIPIAPLREHRQDVPALAEHFLTGSDVTLAPDAVAVLEAFHWPGNVRQLRNVLRNARALASRGVIDRRHLSPELISGTPFEGMGPGSAPRIGAGLNESGTLKEMERQALLRALNASHGHRGQAARSLGINRSTLGRKMRELGIRSPS